MTKSGITPASFKTDRDRSAATIKTDLEFHLEHEMFLFNEGPEATTTASSTSVTFQFSIFFASASDGKLWMIFNAQDSETWRQFWYFQILFFCLRLSAVVMEVF